MTIFFNKEMHIRRDGEISMYCSAYVSPIGRITLAGDGNGLAGLWIDGQRYHGRELFKDMIEKNDLPILVRAKEWLDRYFAGKRPDISELPLSPVGSEFRRTVWKILCEIPYGETITYGDVAKTAAIKMNRDRMSCRAVGGAVGRNPISIIIPCHRVVGSDGDLTGYAGGIDVKMRLLEHEGADTQRLFVPKKGAAARTERA